MSSMREVISRLENMRFIKPASQDEIAAAEKELGLHFAEDYRDYVYNYGVISARGVELTGVTSFPRLSVVNVTKDEREMNPNIPADMYVIENVAIDGILALQDESGKVYTIAPNEAPKYYCASLEEYLKKSNF